MELDQVFVKIGTVKQILPDGFIKARVEGSFDDEDLSKLPPIRFSPFTGTGSFSTPYVGERVWVIGDHSDPLALFWLPINEVSYPQNMPNTTPEHQEMMLKENCSVLIKKPRAGGLYDATYYIDDDGCHVQDGETSVTISNTNGVIIKARNITIGDENSVIKIGSGKDQLALSKVTDRKLTELGALITKVISVIQKAAAGNQFTMPISGVLAELSADIAKLKSDNESTGSGLRI